MADFRAKLAPAYQHRPLPSPPAEQVTPFSLTKRHLRRRLLQTAGQLSRTAKNAWPGPPKKLLLIRPDHLGDMLFLTPTLALLRRHLPDTAITLLAGPWSKRIVADNPHLDRVLLCEFPGFTRQAKPSAGQPYQYLLETARRLKPEGFEAALILRFDHWWGAWLAQLMGVPQRIGYHQPETAPFLTHRLAYLSQRHEVEQNWHLATVALSLWGQAGAGEEPLGPLEFPLKADDRAWASAWLGARGYDSAQKLFVVHPGAGAEVKQWSLEAWGVFLRELEARYGGQIIYSGGPEEVDLCRRVSQLQPGGGWVAAGETSLGQLAALMAHAEVVIGPDTGPLKLAAAVGAKTVQLYGPVSALKFGPWGSTSRHRVVSSQLPCQPCNHLAFPPEATEHHFCVRGLASSVVLAEVVAAVGG